MVKKRGSTQKRATKTVSKSMDTKDCCSGMPHHHHMKKKGMWMLLLGILVLLNLKYGWWSLDALLGTVFIVFGLKKIFLMHHC